MRGEKNKDKPSIYSVRKFLVMFLCVMGTFAAIRHIFPINVSVHVKEETREQIRSSETVAVTKGEDAPEITMEKTAVAEQIEENVCSTDSQMMDNIDIAPDTACQSPKRKGVWSYADCFPDIQDIQLQSAQQYGISPVRNREEAEELVKNHKLVNICHSPYYVVDNLTHSIPYLIPRAQHLLNTISVNFIDSCQVKGLPPHLLMVTSVLRTADDVSNLQKGNNNATTNSCHCYGTTVDIAYNRFMPLVGEYNGNETLLRWNEQMKMVLAEVLYDLRRQGKCYVKHEVKQGCFHLTCR